MPRVEMAVEGMTCDHCETAVPAALHAAGATDAQADYRRGRASASFDGDPAVLGDAIRGAGYTPGRIEPPRRDHLTHLETIGERPIGSGSRFMVEPGDPGADPELKSTGREVVDSERLANEQPTRTQNGIADQRADANP